MFWYDSSSEMDAIIPIDFARCKEISCLFLSDKFPEMYLVSNERFMRLSMRLCIMLILGKQKYKKSKNSFGCHRVDFCHRSIREA